MDVAFLLQTLDKVRRLKHGEAPVLTVEEAGALRAYLDARERLKEQLAEQEAFLAQVRTLLDDWQAAPPPPEPPANRNRRTQTVLRRAVDKLQTGAYQELTRGEAQLAHGTYRALSQRRLRNDRHERLLGILGETLGRYGHSLEIEAAESQAPHQPAQFAAPVEASVFEAAPSPAEVLHESAAKRAQTARTINAEAFFQAQAPRHYAEFAGIPADITARGAKLDGPLAVVGDVPADGLLVVMHGHVTVYGNVAGHVAAAGDVEVMGSVEGGWILSMRGAVTAGQVRPGARLIARLGDVSFGGAERPALVFAGGALTIKGDVLGGALYSRGASVRGTVTDVEVHAAGPFEAHRIARSGQGQTVVRFRHELLNSDYGCTQNPKDCRARWAYAKHSLDVAVSTALILNARRDVLQCMRAMLYYALAEFDADTIARAYRGLQIQAAYTERLLALARLFSHFLGAAHAPGLACSKEELAEVCREHLKRVQSAQRRINRIDDAYGETVRARLAAAAGELAEIVQETLGLIESGAEPDLALIALDERIAAWQALDVTTQREVIRAAQDFSLPESLDDKIQHQPAVLEHMISALRNEAGQRPGSGLAQRFASAFVSGVQASIDQLRDGVKREQAEAEKSLAAREAVREELERRGAVLFAETRPHALSVAADAYDAGVVLTSAPETMHPSEEENAAALEIEAAIETRAVFVFDGHAIRREPS